MTVDGKYTEKWMTTGSFSMLSSSKVFVGGSEAPYKLPGAISKNNFVGCLKKVSVLAAKAFRLVGVMLQNVSKAARAISII